MMTEVSDFNAVSNGNVILDFYTKTCMPCKLLQKVLEEVSDIYQSIKVAKIDVTQNPDMTQMFGVMSVPTMVFMKDSQVQHISHGFSNKESIMTLVREFYTNCA